MPRRWGCGSMGWARWERVWRAWACLPVTEILRPCPHCWATSWVSVSPQLQGLALETSSAFQDKLSVQASGPGLGWGLGRESGDIFPFLPPPSTSSQWEGVSVGDRVDGDTEWGPILGRPWGEEEEKEEHVLGTLSGLGAGLASHPPAWPCGTHTRERLGARRGLGLPSWLPRAAPDLPLGGVRSSFGEGLPSWPKAALGSFRRFSGPIPPPSLQAL